MTLETEAPIETSVDTSVETVVETPAIPATPTPEKPVSIDDTLRAKFRELTKEPATPVRDATGKFAKTEVAAAEATTEVTPEVVTEVPAVAEKPIEAPVTQVDGIDVTKPPSSLKKTIQDKWDKLDPDTRAEFHRREADFHKGLTGYKQMADVGKLLDAEIRPYEAMIREAGTVPQMVIRDFFATAKSLKTGTPEQKAATVAEICRNYGVDIASISGAAERLAAAPQPAQPDPRLTQLEQELQNTRKTVEDFVTQSAQREMQALQAEAQAFAQAPGHEHYEAVRLDMAALIESGRAKDLQDAYDKATWANPEVRATLIAKQQEAERKRAAEKAAAAKKAASTNVAPKGTLPSAPVVGTMEDTLRSALKKIQSRG